MKVNSIDAEDGEENYRNHESAVLGFPWVIK